MSIDGDAVRAVEDLARREALSDAIEDAGSEVVSRVIRDNERIVTLDLESHADAPRRQRGTAITHTPEAFGDYVSRLATPAATMWADAENRTVVAVLNDHCRSATDESIVSNEAGQELRSDRAGEHYPGAPGWRDHRVVLELQPDPDWEAWSQVSGKSRSQLGLAEFLEDMLHTVAEPPAAELLQPILAFTSKRDVQFDSAVRLDSGEVQFVYRDTEQAKDVATLPSELTLRLTPYLGADTVEVKARLRYRLAGGQLQFTVTLIRPDLAEREAWERTTSIIGMSTPAGVPLLEGVAPLPVEAT